MARISPSLLAADARWYEREIQSVEKAGVTDLHIDVMDGHFVSNLSFGPQIVAALRRVSRLRFDVHLMTESPLLFVDAFCEAGADSLTAHVEAVEVECFLHACRKHGVKTGVALCPRTALSRVEPYMGQIDLLLIMGIEPGFGGQEMLSATQEKVHEAAMMRKTMGSHCTISVDGGVSPENACALVDAGADILVAGSAVFGRVDRKAAIDALTQIGKSKEI